MTAWESKDPLDRLLAGLFRNPRFRPFLRGFLVGFLGLYALGLLTTSFQRFPALRLIRAPLHLMHILTQTKQDWAMFKEFPHGEFDLEVQTGRVSALTNEFVQDASLGPIIPGFVPFKADAQLRYYLLFLDYLSQDGSPKGRSHYMRNLGFAIGNRTKTSENRPSHYVLQLSVTPIPDADSANGPPPKTIHRLGPLRIAGAP